MEATIGGETAPGVMQTVQSQAEETSGGRSRGGDDAPFALGQAQDAAWPQDALALQEQERPLLWQQKAAHEPGIHQVKGGVLNRTGQYDKALEAIERCIMLKEQGYTQFGALASAYGEKSQVLMELGRFQEALLFDERALAEVQRLAKSGHRSSQEEVWMYQVNRARLYLRLGKRNEAESLLREAVPPIHPRRRVYRMFAEDALEEIEQWRQQATSPSYQLDWRWIDRYRRLDP